jgi:hypothetical protein
MTATTFPAGPSLAPPTIARSGGVTVWLTGLSGAGKSTLAAAVTERRRAGSRLELEPPPDVDTR